MAKIYTDDDIDLAILKGRKVGVIGYGNQGHAQAQNLRDSGADVVIGNRDDDYGQRAAADGFEVMEIAAAASAADVLLVLIPDEVQPVVYEKEIKANLKAGDALCFASGYNIYYKQIEVPEDVDVIMVAPRMIGEAVRNLYKQGLGYPCLVAAEQDSSGKAMDVALAVAKGIGATRLGAFESSFEEEATIDLFAEQMLWPAITKLCMLYFEKLVDNGCDPEIIASELYLSGEFVEIAKAMITEGFFEQLNLHSQTSQYGQLSRGERMVPAEVRAQADKAMEGIKSGAFAQEWAAEQAKGKPTLKKLWEQVRKHPMAQAEKNLESFRKIAAKAYK